MEAERPAAETKRASRATLRAEFEAAHPDIVAWLNRSTLPFARSLRAQAEARGTLTSNQIEAARSMIADLEEVEQDRRAVVTGRKVIEFGAQHPELMAWLIDGENSTARSLHEGLRKFGGLTDKQLAFAYRLMNAGRKG